ncbi:MAG: hypothetical protein Q9187_003252 [Circinaria calcarea]
MGSLSDTTPSVNLLEYLRSKTQVDCDSLSTQVATDLGPFVDCTSNQGDTYFELLKPERAALLKKSAALGRQMQSEYPNVTFEELAVEISVPSTWEGLQACRKLKSLGVKTLATTAFTIEQAILAAEAGCIYVSPFVHELRVQFDETYHDTDPILSLCVEAQQYFEKYSYSTRVKACSVISVEEIMQLAGVAAFTIAPGYLQAMLERDEPEAKVAELSLFKDITKSTEQGIERTSFVNDEERYREAFASRDGGKGQVKTRQVCEHSFLV